MRESTAHALADGPSHAAGFEQVFARSALDRLSLALLLATANGHVTFANRASVALLSHRDGLRLGSHAGHGRLIFVDKELQQCFGSLLASPGGPHEDARPIAGLRVPRPSGRPDYVVQVARLGPPSPHENRAAIFVTDPCEEHRLDAQLFESVYGLTAAELRIAEGLLGDQPLCEIARALNIRESTARSQLLSLFRKTRTSRQAQLVKLLMALRLWI